MEVDRISNLPGNIVDKILSRLKLKDAVRTSILSRKWRYKWVNLTSLVFDDQLVHVSSKYPPVLRDQMVKIVDRVLLLHNGLIHKFRLSFHGFRDIDRWILFLSRGSVKEIVLEILEICPSDPYFKLGSSLYSCDKPYYKLPSSLYLCDKLSHLQLSNCLLKPPSTFNGFKMLTNLDLSKFSMDQDLLENLIFKCPLLERLTLMDIYGLGHLKIHAPKLTFFDFGGVFEDVTFENTVHLSTVSICFYLKIGNDNESSLGTTSKLIKFFGSLPSIQRLEVESSVLKFLAGDDMVPRMLPAPCIELNYLSLGINFSDMEQCLAALCILRNSPNLMELEMLSQSYKRPASRAVTKKLMEEDYQNCSFNQLRCVKLAGSFGFRRALKFINFLLANSPMLERMTVNPHSEDSAVELLKELVRFRRASAHAEIIFRGP